MKLVFYGAGNMAHAIFTGIVNSKIIESNDIYLTNRSNEVALKAYADELGVNYSYDDEALLKDADYIFLGTKPYDFDALAERIQPYVSEKNKFISIMAGLPMSYIREQLGSDNPIARIMPNTNAHVGHSVTGISFSSNFGPKSKDEVDDLINAFGSAIEVSEDHLHQVTAITGSGPAFLYHVFEQYVTAGTRLGLEKSQVEESIRNLIIGTSKMIERSDLSMEQLRKNITSKGGTTQAGLNALSQYDLESIFEDCLRSAVNRSVELASQDED
ncbi:pyrroline-5-carboxylate reductase [Staphylococcus succinus]|jgi:pyrroline-5-carboxylate reductase|uniref:Pyrroline-5-carboxylate reductase n=1 Tax=Staphylococcus succinus TaxID=61015 RepID=A0A9Q6MV48_9STAP|nr:MULTISPECIES: pyrroline-5-carboxylate reductase [Staphylococcus]MBU0437690.1 pyrroline-5-carboxylate reductase [Staphylococcus succinus]MDH9160016.1 pyrroline-5-carboxylate reductase [Staphylococcus succinus]MEB7461416.1 pyrroline-5-carboxylate reductase [Staphylococcus succinus]MEB8124628.1 pyrroline-5-carboxylate reductase [Staphylococcus succinus]MEB8126619.1 pyrroline-5-carboxylate reductase [Staphylococcus succinus]